MIIMPGATDQSFYFKLVNPTTGVPVTGATITSLDLTYVRDCAAAVKADLTALSLVTSAHADNKAIEIDATNAPGLYRVDAPDAAFATGVDRVQLVVNGAAIDPAVIEVELGVFDDIWANATRTLTQAAATVGTIMQGSTIPCLRGDTLVAAITGLGNISARNKLWFTVKLHDEDADTAALIQIEETAGLKYMNGAAAATPTNGSIVVTNQTTGALTITLKAAETDDLNQCTAKYDIQMFVTSTGVVTTLTSGIFDVMLDQTRVVA